MSARVPAIWVRRYVLAVGAMDAATGVLLVASPSIVLRLMLVPEPRVEAVWLRFIGAFVAGVGLAYLRPLGVRGGRGDALLAATVELTTVVRAAVGSVVAASVASGALPAPWLSVAATDLGLAAFQALVVRRAAALDGAAR